MKCTKCGAKYNEKVKFCIVCGSPMAEEKKSNRGKIAVIIAVIVIVLAAAGFAAWMIFANNNDKPNPGEESLKGYLQEKEFQEERSNDMNSEPSTETEQETRPDVKPAADGNYDQVYSSDYGSTDEYVIPDSDSRYLTREELAYYTDEELELARNEIYARHGRRFNLERLQAYFDTKSWYKGKIAPEDFTSDMLSKIESYNANLIKEVEQSR